MENEKEKLQLDEKDLIINGEDLKEAIAVVVANRFREDNHGFKCSLKFASCFTCDNREICVLRRYRMVANAAAGETIHHFFKIK